MRRKTVRQAKINRRRERIRRDGDGRAVTDFLNMERRPVRLAWREGAEREWPESCWRRATARYLLD